MTTPGFVLVATGVKREAAVLRQQGLIVIPGGGDAAGLRARLEAGVAGACGIASVGLAGALDDTLAIGDWVIGDRLTGTVEAVCHPVWAAALAARLPDARRGAVYADGRLIDTVAEKRAIGARDGALAVDMESHIAASVAADHGLPFAIVRCVSDGARHVLPPAIAVAMRPGGGVDGLAMLRSLARQPGQLPDLMRTIAGFMAAMRALEQGTGLIGARMALA